MKILMIGMALFALIGCTEKEEPQPPTLSPEVQKITQGKIRPWLRNAPFKGEFSANNSGSISISNAHQIFPFMGKYYLANKDINHKNEEQIFLDSHHVIFNDPQWGDLFLHASLLHSPVELFLAEKNTSSGHAVFDGLDAAYTRYDSTLIETNIVSRKGKQKTAIYWANTGALVNKEYLFGFYQTGQLAFQIALPCNQNRVAACLNKLKQVSADMDLNIKQWQDAEPEDLQASGVKSSFWKKHP